MVLVVLAVLTGQLTIGWSNDLVDARRDRQVHGQAAGHRGAAASGRARRGRLVGGRLRGALPRPGLARRARAPRSLRRVGLAYNLGLKSTRWSWLPYAVAFASLPAVVTLAAEPPALPPWPVVVAGGLLGVGAHFVNVLPDLDDDAATGVRGLPHRLGARRSQRAATAVLVTGSLAVVLGPPGVPATAAWVALGVTLLLAVAAVSGTGRTPFRAAVGIALVNVAMITMAG